jgi:hypothetical protein
MKKITMILGFFLLVGVIGAFAQESFTVNLSKLPVKSDKITAARKGGDAYGFYKIVFPAGTFPADLPWAKYNRIKVVYKYYKKDGTEIAQGNDQAMVVLLYDPDGKYEENDNGPGPNTPVKIFNVGGANGKEKVSSPEGSFIKPLTKAPGAILLQRQGKTSVGTIELIELTFFTAK